MLGLVLDPDYGDITDPSDGRDVKVVCTKAPGRMWATTEVRPRGKTSVLSENTKAASGWLESIPNLEDMYEEKSYDALSKIVNDWLNDDESTSNSEPTFGTSRGSTATESTPTNLDSKFKSLDDAFADLEDDSF